MREVWIICSGRRLSQLICQKARGKVCSTRSRCSTVPWWNAEHRRMKAGFQIFRFQISNLKFQIFSSKSEILNPKSGRGFACGGRAAQKCE